MYELSIQLAVTMIGKRMLYTLWEVAIPWLRNKWRWPQQLCELKSLNIEGLPIKYKGSFHLLLIMYAAEFDELHLVCVVGQAFLLWKPALFLLL